MDPLSILASVAGLLIAAGTISSTLVKIRSTLKDVPQSVNQIASEINDLMRSFSALQNFLLGLASAPTRRIALIQLDQLVATLTEAVLAFSELEALVAPFITKPTTATLNRVKWSLKESEITPILYRLQRHKLSLSLMLNIVQCESDLEAERCRVTLQNLVEQLLESNHDISTRLRSLEEMVETQSVLTRCFRNGKIDEIVNEDCGDNATITTNMQAVPGGFEPRKIVFRETTSRFTFEDDLEASRVYSRTQIYKEDISFSSSAVRTHAWSVFSGLSLAEISNISVIALPLYPNDVSNSNCYIFGEQSTTESDEAVSYQEGPLLLTGQLSIVNSNFVPQYPINTLFESPRAPPPIPRLFAFKSPTAAPLVSELSTAHSGMRSIAYERSDEEPVVATAMPSGKLASNGTLSMESGRSSKGRNASLSDFGMAQPTLTRDFEPCDATASMFLYAQGNSIVCAHHDTLTIERRFSNHTEQVQLLAVDNISERGSGRLVVSYDTGQTAIVWDLMTGYEVARSSSYTDLTVATWMRNGIIAFANAQGNVILLEPFTLEHISVGTINQLPITALAPGADCRTFAIGYQNGLLLICTLQPRFVILHYLNITKVQNPIITLAWHTSSSKYKRDVLASQTRDSEIRVWSIPKSSSNTDTAFPIRILTRGENFQRGPNWLGWSKNGRIIQYSMGKTSLWDARTKHVSHTNVPTLEHVRGIALYGPGATLFTLGPNNTAQQFDLFSSPPQLVANVQHPASLLPPSPPVSIEERRKPINVDTVAEVFEEPVFPLAKIAREIDKLEERDQVPESSEALSPASSQPSPSTVYGISRNDDLDAPSSDFEEQLPSSSSPTDEVFTSIRIKMGDPCFKVIPAALKRYQINAPWEQYAMHIVYGDQERCLELDEKPLMLFKRLNREGKKPMFMLRRRTAHPYAAGAEIPGTADLVGSSL